MTNSLNVQHIASLDLPELQPYRTLRRPMDHIKQGIFIAEGEKVVRRLLTSNFTIVSMLMTPEWFELIFPFHHSDIGSSNPEAIAKPPDYLSPLMVFVGMKDLLQSIVGHDLHQGIMAIAKVPAQRTLEETIESIPPN